MPTFFEVLEVMYPSDVRSFPPGPLGLVTVYGVHTDRCYEDFAKDMVDAMLLTSKVKLFSSVKPDELKTMYDYLNPDKVLFKINSRDETGWYLMIQNTHYGYSVSEQSVFNRNFKTEITWESEQIENIREKLKEKEKQEPQEYQWWRIKFTNAPTLVLSETNKERFLSILREAGQKKQGKVEIPCNSSSTIGEFNSTMLWNQDSHRLHKVLEAAFGENSKNHNLSQMSCGDGYFIVVYNLDYPQEDD